MRNILFFFLISIAGCSARKSAEVAMQWDAESPKSLRGQQADGMELAPRRRLFDLSSFLSCKYWTGANGHRYWSHA